MALKVDMATSKVSSPNGSACASATWVVSARPEASATAGPSEQVVHAVGGGDVGPASGGGQGGANVPGGDVEHPLAGVDVEGPAQQLAVEHGERTDPGVMPAVEVFAAVR